MPGHGRVTLFAFGFVICTLVLGILTYLYKKEHRGDDSDTTNAVFKETVADLIGELNRVIQKNGHANLEIPGYYDDTYFTSMGNVQSFTFSTQNSDFYYYSFKEASGKHLCRINLALPDFNYTFPHYIIQSNGTSAGRIDVQFKNFIFEAELFLDGYDGIKCKSTLKKLVPVKERDTPTGKQKVNIIPTISVDNIGNQDKDNQTALHIYKTMITHFQGKLGKLLIDTISSDLNNVLKDFNLCRNPHSLQEDILGN